MTRICVLSLCAVFAFVPLLSAQVPKAGRKVALLVGVNKYKDPQLGTLKCAERDATDLRDLLVSKLGYDKRDVYLMTASEALTVKNEDLLPRSDNIRTNLKGLLEDLAKEDTVMVAFMEHEDLGLVLQPPEGRRMDDAVAVALEIGARRRSGLGEQPTPARLRQDGVGRAGIGGDEVHSRLIELSFQRAYLALTAVNSARATRDHVRSSHERHIDRKRRPPHRADHAQGAGRLDAARVGQRRRLFRLSIRF